MLAEELVVDPNLGIAKDPGDGQNNAPAHPGLRNLDLPLVPALADERMPQPRGFAAIALVVPNAGDANGPVGRGRIAGPRHLGQPVAGPLPVLGLAAALRIGGEIPDAVQAHRLARPALSC